MPLETKTKRNAEPDPHKFIELSQFEDLIKMRTENPKAFAVLSPSLKITLGYYIDQKRKAGKHKR